jgi:hypothetical protein
MECENWATETSVCEVLGIPECANCNMFVPKADDLLDKIEVTEGV